MSNRPWIDGMGHTTVEAIDWQRTERGETAFKRKQLSEAADGENLGCSLYALPAGGRSWPYHYHTANEEALYVLAGSGFCRCDGTAIGLEEGAYVTFPADASGAHRVVNDSDEPLRYLMVSTMIEPDVTVYPDTDTLGVYVGSPPGGREDRPFEGYYDRERTVDYWRGES